MKKFPKNVTRMLATALASVQLLVTVPLGDFQVLDADYANIVSLSAIVDVADAKENVAIEVSAGQEAAVCNDRGNNNKNPFGGRDGN